MEALGAVARLVEQRVGRLLGAGTCGRGFDDPEGVLDSGRRAGRSWSVGGLLVGWFCGDVDVVGVAASGHPYVEVFAVQSGAGEQDPDVGRGALGAVDSAGPAIFGVPGQVAGG